MSSFSASKAWFCALVQAGSKDDFYSRYFEREALHVPKGSEPSGLQLTPDELSRLVLGDPSLALRVETVTGGRKLCNLEAEQGNVPTVLAVKAAMEAGSTVRLIGVKAKLPSVVDWADRIGEALGGQAGVNAYLTPASTPGVAAHYDTHEVLVQQVSGSKHWSVFVPKTDHRPFLPMPSESGREIDGSRVEKRSLTLHPGDLLYIPRGAAHATVGGDEASVHLTYGVQPVRWRDRMLNDLLSVAEDDDFFRRAVREDEENGYVDRVTGLFNQVLNRYGQK